MMLSKRNGILADDEGKNDTPDDIFDGSVHEENGECSVNLNHAQKLRKMHKAVTQILQKTQKTKEHLKNMRQEVEVTCEELKNEPYEVKNETNEFDLSEISSHETENVWNEIKNLEQQLLTLKQKVKTGEECIRNRKKQGDEIKELIHELEGLQVSRCKEKQCECKNCRVF